MTELTKLEQENEQLIEAYARSAKYMHDRGIERETVYGTREPVQPLSLNQIEHLREWLNNPKNADARIDRIEKWLSNLIFNKILSDIMEGKPAP